eukprot:scaffold1562_cov323-Prasinococcus_capsulatus_cf.AAC.4
MRCAEAMAEVSPLESSESRTLRYSWMRPSSTMCKRSCAPRAQTPGSSLSSRNCYQSKRGVLGGLSAALHGSSRVAASSWREDVITRTDGALRVMLACLEPCAGRVVRLGLVVGLCGGAATRAEAAGATVPGRKRPAPGLVPVLTAHVGRNAGPGSVREGSHARLRAR